MHWHGMFTTVPRRSVSPRSVQCITSKQGCTQDSSMLLCPFNDSRTEGSMGAVRSHAQTDMGALRFTGGVTEMCYHRTQIMNLSECHQQGRASSSSAGTQNPSGRLHASHRARVPVRCPTQLRSSTTNTARTLGDEAERRSHGRREEAEEHEGGSSREARAGREEFEVPAAAAGSPPPFGGRGWVGVQDGEVLSTAGQVARPRDTTRRHLRCHRQDRRLQQAHQRPGRPASG